MKKYLAAALSFVLMALVLTGCGSTQMGVQARKNESGYYFESNGEKIYINAQADALTEKLGAPSGGTYEALSCAFQGKDTFYYYDGFTLQAYEKNGKKYIYTINLEDDTVKTAEGVKIGDSFAAVTTKYGSGYTAAGNTYAYAKDKMTLTFVVENDKVAAITYALVTE